MIIICGIIAIIQTGVLLYVKPFQTTGRQWRYALIFSYIFTFLQVIGRSYEKYKSWKLMFGTVGQFIKAASLIIASSALLACGILFAVYLLKLLKKRIGKEQKSMLLFQLEDGSRTKKKRFELTVAAIFLAWTPYFIIFFPGTNFQDTMTQIMQYFHLPSETAGITLTDGVTTFFSNHHPFLLTVIYGTFVKLGVLIGNPGIGVALFSILQMAFLALTFAASIFYMEKCGANAVITKAMCIIYACYPYFSYNSIAMVKDVIYSAWILIMTMFLMELIRTKAAVINNKKYCIGLFVSIMLVMMTKNQGVFIIFLIGVIMIIKYRSQWKRLGEIFGAALFLFVVVYSTIILGKIGVISGGVQEALGVPFQQTARVVKEKGQFITEHDKESIDQVLEYNSLAESYNPTTVDPVKAGYKDPTKKELMGYMKVWLSQLIKYPDVYIEAYFNTYYPCFYASRRSEVGYPKYFNVSFRKKFLEENGVPEEEYSYLAVHQNSVFSGARKWIQSELKWIQKIPILGTAFSVGSMFWVAIGIGLVLCFKKKFENLLYFMPVWLTMLVSLVSPVFDKRYVFPIVFCLPLMAASKSL